MKHGSRRQPSSPAAERGSRVERKSHAERGARAERKSRVERGAHAESGSHVERGSRAERRSGAESIAAALAVSAVVALGVSGPVTAHHSQAPFFDQSRDVEIDGVVQRFDFRNPHAILYVEVADAGAAPVVWELQFASATILVRAGVSAESFEAGERVSAVGHPARNPDARALASVAVTKADGTEIVDPLRSGRFTPDRR